MFEDEAEKIGGAESLPQGTLHPDVIEQRPIADVTRLREPDTLKRMVLTKSVLRAYERQHRMIAYRAGSGTRAFPPAVLRAVICGVRTSLADETAAPSSRGLPNISGQADRDRRRQLRHQHRRCRLRALIRRLQDYAAAGRAAIRRARRLHALNVRTTGQGARFGGTARRSLGEASAERTAPRRRSAARRAGYRDCSRRPAARRSNV